MMNKCSSSPQTDAQVLCEDLKIAITHQITEAVPGNKSVPNRANNSEDFDDKVYASFSELTNTMLWKYHTISIKLVFHVTLAWKKKL